jgi:hypothetical protein
VPRASLTSSCSSFRATRPSTGCPFRCATRAPLNNGVNGKGFGLWGDLGGLALVPGLADKPAESGEHQGRLNPRLIWLL